MGIPDEPAQALGIVDAQALQPNAHHQVAPLLTNGLDTTGSGDVIVCVWKAGHSAGMNRLP